MRVSFEINDVREVLGVWVATPVMVERPKSAMQARRSPLISMFACADEVDVSAETFHLGNFCTPFRSPWTTQRSCIYFKPFATSTS